MAPLSIGRSRSCSIIVDAPTVSRHHADLTEVSRDRYRFEDRGSTSGSYRLEEGAWRRFESAEIDRGDRVRLGDFECTLEQLLGQVRPADDKAARTSPRPRTSPPAQTVIERDPATGQIVVRRL